MAKKTASRTTQPSAAAPTARRPRSQPLVPGGDPGVDLRRPGAPHRPSAAEQQMDAARQRTAERLAASPAVARPVPVRVQATKKGFYDLKRRRVGDVFTVPSLRHVSKNWMVVVPDGTPERITTGAQDLQQQHDEILGATFNRAAATSGIVGPSDDLGPGEKSPLDD